MRDIVDKFFSATSISIKTLLEIQKAIKSRKSFTTKYKSTEQISMKTWVGEDIYFKLNKELT